MKKLIMLIVALIICIPPLSSFASLEALPAEYVGNTDLLIDIRNPEAPSTSTSSSVCVISAVALPNTTITLYSYDEVSGLYNKMYVEAKALEAVVGASGLYSQNIELKDGMNKILVVASSGELTETAKLEITLIKNSLVDSLRNLWQSIIGH